MMTDKHRQASVSTRSKAVRVPMAATLATLVVLLTAACGQKGPLTLTPPSKAKAGGDKVAPAFNQTPASGPSAQPSGRAASAP